MKSKIIFLTFLFLTIATTIFAQDDNLTGKVVDGISRKEIGKAEIITTSDNFGFYIKMWLTGSKLRIIRPNSGSRATTMNCSFREYKVSASDPKNQDSWEEIGSGTATLQTPVGSSGDVEKMLGSMTLTEKIVNDKEVKVTERAQKFEIIIE